MPDWLKVSRSLLETVRLTLASLLPWISMTPAVDASR